MKELAFLKKDHANDEITQVLKVTLVTRSIEEIAKLS